MSVNRIIDWDRFYSIFMQALSKGADISNRKIEWDASQNCERPALVALTSAPPKGVTEYVHLEDGDIYFIDMLVPCRKCTTCLKSRARLWRRRARYEMLHSYRTWFVTLTVEPDWRWKFELEITSEKHGRDKWDFKHHYRLISKEVTKMFKRLRSKGHKFRFLMAAEAHKDGYPHIHLLIHETEEFSPIPKREIQRQWRFGFSHCKLTDLDAANYVTKYLAKDMLARVRASLGYGQGRSVDRLPNV